MVVAESRRARRRAGFGGPLLVAIAIIGLAPGAVGCARTLVDRAIAARGGPLESLYREVDASVREGFPGEWTWQIAYRYPDLLRWTIETYGDEQSYVYDGRAVVLYLGSAALPVDAPGAASFRTQARWFAVTALDVLQDSGRIEWHELPAAGLPAGIAHAVEARFLDDGALYRLFFDARDLLVAAEGDVALPPIGSGRLRAEYGEFRGVDGYTLAFAGRYTLSGRPLVDEQVRRYVANDPALTAASFETGPP